MKFILKQIQDLSIRSKLRTIIILVSLGFMLSMFLVFKKGLGDVQSLNLNQMGNHYVKGLSGLLNELVSYQMLRIRFNSNEKAVEKEFSQLERVISEHLQVLNHHSIDKALEEVKKQNIHLRTSPGGEFKDLMRQWQQFTQSNRLMDGEEQLERLYRMTRDVYALIIFVGATTNHPLNGDLHYFTLIDVLYDELPQALMIIPRLIAETVDPHANNKNQFLSLLSQLNTNMENTRSMFSRAYFQVTDDVQQSEEDELSIQHYFDSYLNELVSFLRGAEQILSDKNPLLVTSLKASGVKLLSLSKKLTDEMYTEIDTTIEKERRAEIQTLIIWGGGLIFLYLITTSYLGLTLLAFERSSTALLRTANKLFSGEVDARVQAFGMDELGRFGLILNASADRYKLWKEHLDQSVKKSISCLNSLDEETRLHRAIFASRDQGAHDLAYAGQNTIDTLNASFSRFIKSLTNSNSPKLAGITTRTSALELVDEVHRVSDTVKSISTQLDMLSTRAGLITNIISPIAKIAEEIERLSLNVAIQAEKNNQSETSSSKQSGFLVIAQQIRQLANETSRAVTTIEESIDEMMIAVNANLIGFERLSNNVSAWMEKMMTLHQGVTSLVDLAEEHSLLEEEIQEEINFIKSGIQPLQEALSRWKELIKEESNDVKRFQISFKEMAELKSTLLKIEF